MLLKLRAPTDRPKAIRAVHPNAGVEAWFYQQLDALLQGAWIDAELTLALAWNEAPPTVGIAMDAPSSTKKIDEALKRWGDRWGKKLDRAATQIAKSFTSRAAASTETAFTAALKSAGFIVQFKPSKTALEAYRLVSTENVGLIRNLQSSFYGKIQQDVWAAVRAGADMSTLSQKLQKSYGIEKKRAALIARDQNAKAKAVIETTRRKELGIEFAIWQHSSAGKEPRPTHVAMNGKRYDLKKGMYDEDEKRFVFPGELINCRCTSRAIIPGVNEE